MRWSVKPEPPEWGRWFAWIPARVGEQWVWLEMLERRSICEGWSWEYRFPKKPAYDAKRHADYHAGA